MDTTATKNKKLDGISLIENEQIRNDLPDFSPSDTVVVKIKIKEGDRERIQAFEGVVIGKKNKGVHSTFTVRKISYGEGVERCFPLHSQLIQSIEVKKYGKVRRAKLYYLRGRTGRAANIKQKLPAKKNK